MSVEQLSLGKTDLTVSPLGIGTWAWGDRLVWGYGRGGYSDEDIRHAFAASLEAGVNLFDTAEIYGMGRSEEMLGRLSMETEEPIVIATKFMPYPWRLRGRSLLRALRGSLKRLGRVDLYQIHQPLPPVGIETWMDALAEAVEAGLVRAVGVSNYDEEQMRRAHAALAKRGVPLASNQVEYSLLQRAPEENGVLAACRELEVTLIAYSPLAQGLLTGKYTPDNPPPGVRRLTSGSRLESLPPLVDLMHEIGAEHAEEGNAKTPAQVALNWTMCQGTIPIPGAKNERQARDNAGAMGWRLTAAEVAALDEAAAKV